MAWKKYFTPVSTTGKLGPISGSTSIGGGSNPSRTNYSSYLPDVYAGHPNRLERYGHMIPWIQIAKSMLHLIF